MKAFYTSFSVVLLCLALSGCIINNQEYNYPPGGMAIRNLPSFPMPGWELPGHAARVSSYDRTGHNVDAIKIMPGETVVLADIRGPGIIRHIWSTTNAAGPFGRTLVIRMYWDGDEYPAVEAPYGDFFAEGHAMEAEVDSWPISVSSRGRSRNCWWRMPFSSGALITATNEGDQPHSAFYYYIDYLALDGPPLTRQRFHAWYNQAYPADFPENYLILKTRGRGSFLGCIMNFESTEPNWWGEGDDLIGVDDNEPLHGTGTEDYFCEAWGMREHDRLFHGSSICEGYNAAGLRSTIYRFHILDPIPFHEKIKVSIEHGTENDREDNLSSVAFWYQAPQAGPLPPMAPVLERVSAEERKALIRSRAWRVATSDAEDSLTELGDLLETATMEENKILINGLIAYARGKKNPTDAELAKMDALLSSLEEKMSKMSRDELYTKPEIDIPTDDDNLVPGPLVITHLTLERARHDLARDVALERGLREGDEIIVEVRDPMGNLTPPPLYQETEDFTNSYAKVDDPFVMGNGARFTYGDSDPSWARFTPEFPETGRYEVLVIFSYGSNASDTRYVVKHAAGDKTIPLPQKGRVGTTDRNNKEWHSLGTYRFEKGQNPEKGSVTLHASPGTTVPNEDFEYRAYSDSVRFIYKGQ